jgi:hypothetical protein
MHTNRQSMMHAAMSAECHRICEATIKYCLDKGGKYADSKHIQALLDCAEICQTTSNFILRESTMHERVCAICAEICTKCAESCEQVDASDDMMKHCADVCRRCAEACQQMMG